MSTTVTRLSTAWAHLTAWTHLRTAPRRHGRSRARALTGALALLCAVGLALLGPASSLTTARADSCNVVDGIIICDTAITITPPGTTTTLPQQICLDGSGQLVACNGQTCVTLSGQQVDCGTGQPITTPLTSTYRPADLLNLSPPLYAATNTQRHSLQNLEQAAVTDIIQAHGLPASDAVAVQTWGRDDAEGALWGQLVQAIQTAPASRTADQQNAVDWFTAVVQRENAQAAQDAGLQYVKWAGLDQSYYTYLLGTNPSASTLQTFLCGGDCSFGNATALPYNFINSNGQAINPKNSDGSFNFAGAAQSTGGFCVYTPPAPYQAEYTANIFTPASQSTASPTCYTPCTSVLGCPPPTPSYDQFVKWGEASATYQLVNTADFAQTARAIAIGGAFGGAVVGAGVTGVVLSAALSGALTGSVLQQAIHPFLARPIQIGTTAAGRLILSSADKAAAIAGAETAADVGFIAGVVIEAVATAVLAGISVANATNLPGQLATLIANAPTISPDLAAMLNDATQTQSLYSLFVGATLPAPLFQSCDNVVLSSGQAPCLNAPAIPAPAPTDPWFALLKKGVTGQPPTAAAALTWTDAATGLTSTARLSGQWFIDQVTASDGTTITAQTLRIHYTDWNGQGQTAWLLHDPLNPFASTDPYAAYSFLTVPDQAASDPAFDPATCAAAALCNEVRTIDYVGPDGVDYSAAVVPPIPTLSWSPPAHITYGTPLDAAIANAVARVAGMPITGTYDYTLNGTSFTPGPGEVLPATRQGVNQLGVVFVPSDRAAFQPAASPTFPLTVDSAPLTVTASNTSKVYGAPDPSFDATYQGLVNGDTPSSAVQGLVLTGAPATSTVGSYPIVPSGTSSNYALTYVNGTETITTAPLTITARDKSMTYGGSVPAFDASYSGLANGDSSSVVGGLTCGANDATGTPVSSTTPAGTFAIRCRGGSAANYSLSYQAGTLTINGAPLTITANDQRMLYGDSVPIFDASYSGLANGDSSSVVGGLTCGANDATGTPVSSRTPYGVYTIRCSGASAANYRLSYQVGTLYIDPRLLILRANDQSKVYGAPDPPFAVSIGVDGVYSLVNGDTLAFAVPNLVLTGAPATSGVGTYPIVLSGARSCCYNPQLFNGTETITTAPLTITARDKSMTYGGTVPAFDASFAGLVNGDTSSVVSGVTCGAKDANGNAVSSTTPAGTYAITCSGGSAANYSLSYQAGTLTINGAPLTITATNQTMLLHGALPALTVGYSGFVNGDTAATLSTAPTCSTTATSTSPAGRYPITCAKAVAHNYALSYVPGTLAVRYRWTGFQKPLNDPVAGATTLSVFKAGSTILAKFQLTDANGVVVPAASLPLFAVAAAPGCTVGPVNQPLSTATADTGTTYRATSTGYAYKYKSASTLSGQCQSISATLDDGTTHSVTIGFK